MPRTTMPDDRTGRDGVAAIVAHLRTAACLPFPAGSLVPGGACGHGPLVLPGLPHAARARLAVALMQAEIDEVAGFDHPVSKLAGLMGDAAADWFDQHPDSPWQAAGAPASARQRLLLQALTALALGLTDDGRELAVQDFIERGDHRADRAQGGGRRQGPAYTAPAYRCGCERARQDGPPELIEDAAVSAQLARPGGEWTLLSLFFLKQLHAHLGWWAKARWDEDLLGALYRPVHQVLQSLGRRGDTGASVTAAGLVSGLDRLAPYYKDAEAGEKPADGLPDCFDAGLLSPLDTALGDARCHLAAYPLLVGHADVASELARDVAAVLSDPFTAPRLALTAESFGHVADHLAARQKLLHRLAQATPGDAGAAQAGKAVRSPAGPGLHGLAFLDPAILARSARVLTYARWMQRRGLRLACAVLGAAARPGPPPLHIVSRPNAVKP